MDAFLKEKGGQIMGWHEFDPDHMREAVCYKNLTRLSGIGLSIFTDSTVERVHGNEHNILEQGSVFAPHLSRDSHLFLFTPSADISLKILQFLLSPPQRALVDGGAIWNPPEVTAVQKRVSLATPPSSGSSQTVLTINTAKIHVCIRVRPFLMHEKNRPRKPLYQLDSTPEGHAVISFQRRNQQKASYVFDDIFSFCSGNTGNRTCRAGVTAAHAGITSGDVLAPVRTILERVTDGSAHGSVLAYGQTAAGKTYTMMEILRFVAQELMRSGKHTVTAQYMQIYNDRMYDLLAQNKPCSAPSLLYAQTVQREEDLLRCYDIGNETRSTAVTAMNATSSRSHAILTITLHSNGRKLCLVDLAGG